MNLGAILSDLTLFLALVFGLGLPCVLGRRFTSAEKLALGAAIGVFQIYIFSWVIYWTGLPRIAFGFLAALALLSAFQCRRQLVAFLSNPEVKGLMGRQLVFTGWCVGWLALVRSYGGGEWSADWYEHYRRALFFLDRLPLDTMFLKIYSLPARPPLANLVDGAFMAIGGSDFAHFQLFNTLGSSLIFLPAVLLARNFARTAHRADDALLLMLILNPLVVQNATYSWTKLLAAFYILLAIAFYVRGLAENDATRRTIAIAAIATGLLTHYSAAPYAVGLAVAGLALALSRWRSWSIWRELTLQGLLAVVLLATWFVWSVDKYGVQTFSSNTTASSAVGVSFGELTRQWVWNIFVTVVPHPFHSADYLPLAQLSSPGYLRDYWFDIYQTTLPGAVGVAGLVLAGWALFHRPPAAGATADRWFWRCFPLGVFLLGIATTPWRDHWGVIHICLPALIIVAIAWLAPRLPTAPKLVRRVWAGALALDLALGIALHFYLQATITLPPNPSPALINGQILEQSQMATRNMLVKLYARTIFVSDLAPTAVVIFALGLFLGLVVWRFTKAPTPADS